MATATLPRAVQQSNVLRMSKPIHPRADGGYRPDSYRLVLCEIVCYDIEGVQYDSAEYRILRRFWDRRSGKLTFQEAGYRRHGEDERSAAEAAFVHALEEYDVAEIDLSRKAILKRYRCLAGHLICASLGYASPELAGLMIQNHLCGKPSWCEWYDSMVPRERCNSRRDKIQALLEVGRDTLARSFDRRHRHAGAMAEYQQAKAIVDNAIGGGKSPNFGLGSWF